MKTGMVVFALAALVAPRGFAQDMGDEGAAKSNLEKVLQKLAECTSYEFSGTTRTEGGPGGGKRREAIPVEGAYSKETGLLAKAKAAKGCEWATTSEGTAYHELPEGEWKRLEERAAGEREPGREGRRGGGLEMMIRNFRPPHEILAILAGGLPDAKIEAVPEGKDTVYTLELSSELARKISPFRPKFDRAPDAASGTARVWTLEGNVRAYDIQTEISATMGERELNLKWTAETKLSDFNGTVEIPKEALEALEQKDRG